MSKAYELRAASRFAEAVETYRQEIAVNPDKLDLLGGLAKAYMGDGRYAEAIPLLLRSDEYERRMPGHPGQQLALACAHWCMGERGRAIALAHGLCADLRSRAITMAPDLAGGATYGLVLHYMACTARDEGNLEYARKYLERLNVKYDKEPDRLQAPQQSVRQLLGKVGFEAVIEEATSDVLERRQGTRDLDKAKTLAGKNITIRNALRVSLFHDGVLSRVAGDEAGFLSRMYDVLDLGIDDSSRWYLARCEVELASMPVITD